MKSIKQSFGQFVDKIQSIYANYKNQEINKIMGGGEEGYSIPTPFRVLRILRWETT